MGPRTARRWSGATLCLAALVLAQCGQNSTPPEGAVTGIASPCVGPMTSTTYRDLPVTVYLTRQARPVAEQTVKGTHTYRFVIPAGNYVVATHEGEGSKPVSATVHVGGTTHANIPSFCR